MTSTFKATADRAKTVAREKARGAQAEFDQFAKTYLTRRGRDILETAVSRYSVTGDDAALDAECVRAVRAGY